ncbi:MAG: arylsulfatase [Pirellulales bacterium]
MMIFRCNSPAACGAASDRSCWLKQLVVVLSVVGSWASIAAAEVAGTSERPNIVVILADDFGYGSAGCYGADSELIRTPNLDRLAREGRRFIDANTTSSVCSPTRYSLLTGRYCWRTSLKSGVLGVYSPLHIEPTRLNLASLTKSRGYATAAVGKWHLGYGTATASPKWRVDYSGELSPGPLDIGFDYHFAVPANHGDLTGVYVEDRFVYGLRTGHIPAGRIITGPAVQDAEDYQATYEPKDTESGKATILDLDAPRRKNERVMHVLTEKAVRWMETQPKEKPFFLYFTPVAVHNPITPDADLAGRSKAGLYGDWIHELDRSVGRILDSLDRTGRANSTLVLFSSDNGGVFKPDTGRDTPQNRAIAAGLKVNGALRGGKHDVWEGGFKVPLLARWPGHVPANSVCTEMVSLADVLATTSELLGSPLPSAAEGAEDSRSFLSALLDKKASSATTT